MEILGGFGAALCGVVTAVRSCMGEAAFKRDYLKVMSRYLASRIVYAGILLPR